MSCSNLTAGIPLDCLGSEGGIEKVFIANGPVESITETAGVISAITVGGSALAPADFFSFGTPKQTSSLTETPAISQENGTISYQQDLILVMNKLDAAKRNQILLMAEANAMVIVAKDNNGLYWSVGVERGGFVSAATGTSGTAFADRSGYELTLSGLESKPMFAVDASIVE